MKSITAILTVLFFICVFVIGRRYFGYQTITNVKPVNRVKDIPNLKESFCVSRTAKDYGTSGLDISITLNGIPVNAGAPYIAQNYICRDILNTSSGQEFIVDQYFKVEYDVRKRKLIDGHRYGIIRTLDTSLFEHSAYLCEPGIRTRFRISLFQTYMYRMFLIGLLHHPYDTGCINHKSSSLQNPMRYHNESTKGCGRLCKYRNCNSLMFQRSSLSVHPLLAIPLIGFSKHVIVMESVPEISGISITQQLVGLITLFFDIAIIDICTPLIPLGKYCYITIKFKPVRKLFKKRKNLQRILFFLMILFGLSYHLYIYINNYLMLGTSAETFFGETNDLSLPSMKICPRGSMRNDSEIEILVYGAVLGIYKLTKSECLQITPNIAALELPEFPFYFNFTGVFMIEISFSYTLPVPSSNHQVSALLDTQFFYGSQIFQYQSLPAPYWTNCMNYRERMDRYNSSEHCYEVCLLSYSKSSYACRLKCYWRDCFKKTLIFDKEKSYISSDLNMIFISRWTRELSITTSPQQSWIEFITYTVSVLGLWLGLSAMNIPRILDHSKKSFLVWIRLSIEYSIYCFCFIQMYLVFKNYMTYEIVSKVNHGIPVQYG